MTVVNIAIIYMPTELTSIVNVRGRNATVNALCCEAAIKREHN
jgi:predicted transposase YbfD/YdcC